MNKYKGYEIKSAYSSEKKQYADFVIKNRPEYCYAQGGKGLTNYTRPVLSQLGGMGKNNPFVISSGCPANCGFCKESNRSRSYTEINVHNDVSNDVGLVEFEFEGNVVRTPRENKVKYFDIDVGVIKYGEIGISLQCGFPISKGSIEKIMDGSLFRVLKD